MSSKIEINQEKLVTDTTELVKSLTKESERAAVVLGAAKLDSLFELLLKRALAPCAGGKDDLLDAERPLGTFSAKISIAYRLGLIDKDVEFSLQAIRKIRNSFAHSIENENLAKASHHDRLFEISRKLQEQKPYKNLADGLKSNLPIEENFATFCGIIMVLTIGLEIAAHSIERIKPNRIYKLS